MTPTEARFVHPDVRAWLRLWSAELHVLLKRAVVALLVLGGATVTSAQQFNNIEYLCAAWGPAMKLLTKPGDKPQFSDPEEEVYFLKQVGSFTRKLSVPDPLGGKMTHDEGKGISIYLCKMKLDGSSKTEIRELWKNLNHPIDTQGQSTWMDVNKKTHKIALSVALAGSDITGLWTMNLDGSDLRRIITPSLVEGHLQSINSPNWTPDGQWIVFAESVRGAKRGRIARCDTEGKNLGYLTDGPADGQSRVSPDGKRIAYIHREGWASRLWLMNVDGSGQHSLPNPDDKQWETHGGTDPAWSPDGKRILIIGSGSDVIDVTTGHTIFTHRPIVQGRPGTCGWPCCGESGFVGFCVGGILYTDLELREAKWIGSSKLVECTGAKESYRW